MTRRTKRKPVSGQEKKLEAAMRATNLVFKRFEDVQKRIKTLGKRVYAMPPHQRAAAIITFNLMVGKKDMRKLLDSDMGLSHEACDELVPLLEMHDEIYRSISIQQQYDEVEEDIYEDIILENSSFLLGMVDIAEGYNSPVYSGHTTTRKLIEELKQLRRKNGKKIAPKTDHEPTKEAQITLFLEIFSKLYNKLASKLPEYGIDPNPENIEKTILKMTEWVSRLHVRKTEGGSAKPTPPAPKVIKEGTTPVSYKLRHLLELAD
jgi:hypothetical protein